MKKLLLAVLSMLATLSMASCVLGGGSTSSTPDASSVESYSSVGESGSTSEETTSEEGTSEETEDPHTHSGVKTEAKAANCEEAGNIAYWTCECEKIFSDEACTTEITLADTVIAATGHDGVKTEAKAATCEEAGNIAYWTCECEKIFSDEACTTEITLADTVIAATGHDGVKTEEKAATCEEAGNVAYWTCACGKLFSDEACTTEITLADTVLDILAHDYDGNGLCVCGRDLTNKAIWANAGEACASVEYTEGLGWKATAAGEENYTVKINHEVTSFYMEQGNELITLTFCKQFDGSSYENTSSLHCYIWILPPKAADGGNDWDYPVSRKMQLELDKNADGTYSHTIDLTNEAYDFTKYDLKIYVDYKAANTGSVVGSIYLNDISYGVPVDLEDRNVWVTASDNCASATYTEGKGWKVSAESNSNYYIKINHAVTASYIEQGNDQMTITFCGAFDGVDYNGSSPLYCFIWILPPKAADGGNDWNYPVSQKMQTQLDKNADGTYSHTIDLTNDAYDFMNYDVTLYIDYKAANTGAVVGSIYIQDIAYSVKPEVVEPEKANYLEGGAGESSVTYTEGKGWKVTAEPNANATSGTCYNFYLAKEVIQYYVNETGATKLTITVGGSFDGTSHSGNPVNCQEWIIPKSAAGSDDWSYKNGFFSGWTSLGGGKYAYTIDLTNANYNFLDYDLRIRVSYWDNGTGGLTDRMVGATYIYDIAFSA